MREGDTIAVVGQAFAWSMDPATPSGHRPSLSLYGPQPSGRIATNQGRARGSILGSPGDSIPDLLRRVAGAMDQQGIDTLDGLAEWLGDKRGGDA